MKKRKRVYIDGLGLVDGHFSGIGQYILGIIRGLDELMEEAKYAGTLAPDIRVIVPRDEIKKFKKFGFKHIGYRSFPLPFRYMSALWRRRWLPPLDLFYGRAVYIFPRFVNMPLIFSKSALVIFDLSYELHREYSDEGNAIFLSRQVRKSLKSTDKVIAISKNAKQEILDFYSLDDEMVKVATPAADQSIFYRRSSNEIKKVKEKYGIKGDYILALSNLEPRKNLSSLVEAYCSLPKDVRKNTALLLVGVMGWKTDELFNKIIGKVEEGYDIIRPSSYVKDGDKPAIISGAKMLVYPSHYEGFGMPPLEALACGVPVITADNSSLPEVVGDAGTMLPSHDVELLTKTMEDYLREIENKTASSLTTGPQRAREFSWSKSSKVFLDVIKDLS
jgi:glycosyltransferase involved in cell wall biosynthesis